MTYNDSLYYGFSVINLILSALVVWDMLRLVIRKRVHLSGAEERLATLAVFVSAVVITAQIYSLKNEGIMWPHKAQGFLISIFLLLFAKYLKHKE